MTANPQLIPNLPPMKNQQTAKIQPTKRASAQERRTSERARHANRIAAM